MFSVLQLQNLAIHFKKFAPTGLVWLKDFLNIVNKLRNSPAVNDFLPDTIFSFTLSQLQRVCVDTVRTYQLHFSFWCIMTAAALVPWTGRVS